MCTDWRNGENWQRTIMIIIPLLMGCSASATVRSLETLKKYSKFLKLMIIPCWISLLFTESIFSDVELGRAVAGIFVCFIGSMYCINVVENKVLSTIGLLLCLSWCFVAQTRGPFLSLALTIPIFIFRKNYWWGIATAIMIIIVGIFLFNTEAVQQRIFYSGSGTWEDIAELRFNSSGRLYNWSLYWYEIIESPWFGHGANASQRFGLSVIGESWAHPHNEYIRILFDFGIVGLACWLIGIYTTIQALVKVSKSKIGFLRNACLSAIVAILMMMLLSASDNVLVYATFFGNPLFVFIGCIFGISYGNNYNSHLHYEK